MKAKLDKLNDQSRKDDVVTFEELGVDRLFVDEAHNYKNLAAYTKCEMWAESARRKPRSPATYT